MLQRQETGVKARTAQVVGCLEMHQSRGALIPYRDPNLALRL